MIMNAAPAAVAGVLTDRCGSTARNVMAKSILACWLTELIGIREIYKWAVLRYCCVSFGTETVPKVEKLPARAIFL